MHWPGPGSPYLGTSNPVCVYRSHRLHSWHVQTLFYSFMASSQSHRLPCRALYLSMYTRGVLTFADCFKRKNGFLLCARNWRSHGFLKATLKKASSASFFSPIWLSNRGFHQRKKLSLPFMNQEEQGSRRVERLAVTMTVGFYKQVRSLLFFKFLTTNCCSNNQKRDPPWNWLNSQKEWKDI